MTSLSSPITPTEEERSRRNRAPKQVYSPSKPTHFATPAAPSTSVDPSTIAPATMDAAKRSSPRSKSTNRGAKPADMPTTSTVMNTGKSSSSRSKSKTPVTKPAGFSSPPAKKPTPSTATMRNGNKLSARSADKKRQHEEKQAPARTKRKAVDNGSSKNASRPTVVVAKRSDEKKCRVCNATHSMRKLFTYEKKEYGAEDAWIDTVNCSDCLSLFHIGCIGMQPFEKLLVDSFCCAACTERGGATTMKTPDQLGETSMKIGGQRWIATFLKPYVFQPHRTAPDQTEYGVIEMADGNQFMQQFDTNGDWKAIFLISSMAGLGLAVPPEPFGMDELVKMMNVDPTTWLDNVIDVAAQTTTQMTLDKFVSFFKHPVGRSRIYNILSLEYSKTGLAAVVIPPAIYKLLSIADRYWPLSGASPEQCDPTHVALRPAVERYVLIGMGGSYTDFHIDFGGSSVWYHVFQGEKVFFVAPPTDKNLALFEKHVRSDAEYQAATFLGDSLEDCWKVTIKQGQTLLIPSGYVHAVYTPVDSIVFGGNFLTFQSMEQQIAIHRMDKRRRLGDMFGYPNFDGVMFYSAMDLARQFEDHHSAKSKGEPVPSVPDHLHSATSLLGYLKGHKDVSKKSKVEFARGLTHWQIMKMLEDSIKMVMNYEEAESLKEEKTEENGNEDEEIDEKIEEESEERKEDEANRSVKDEGYDEVTAERSSLEKRKSETPSDEGLSSYSKKQKVDEEENTTDTQSPASGTTDSPEHAMLALY